MRCRLCSRRPAVVLHGRCGTYVCSLCAAEEPLHCPWCLDTYLEVPDVAA